MGSRLEQKSNQVRKRIEQHEFGDETGEEYGGSAFGGFSDYFRRKKIKLQNLDAELRSKSADKPPIFKGVVCHVNGYTQPSLNDLHTMIVQHGGGFIQYLDGKTMATHIIASNLTPKKAVEFKRYRIVKPAWVVDSLAAGKLLPWDAYRVVDEGVGQKLIGFENGSVVSQVNRKQRGYRDQTDASWYTGQLKSQAEGSHPNVPKLTQTITPEIDEIDDECSLSEISSSVEQALREAEALPPMCDSASELEPVQQSETSVAPQTPPLSGPPQNVQRGFRDAEIPQPTLPPGNNTNTEAAVDISSSKDVTVSALRPRQFSQEADFSHAVIRNSDVMNSVSPSELAKMTAEEHNALLLSDPKIRKSTVVHPDFLEQYYNESRLHHLSAWKADLKSQLQAFAAEQSSSQKAKHKRTPGQRRYVMHVDFDSFFAAVSLKQHPQYRDKPAVVAHGGGSGSEIASCNYAARAFGISNGMWMRRAQELCPELKVLPYDFPAYEDVSRKFYEVIMATDGIVQSVSIDEALVDISAQCITGSGSNGVQRNEGAVHREQTAADEIAKRLRDEVYDRTGCAVSVGIGANILQAKVALRRAKPAGQYQLRPEEVLDFIGELEVTKLPGVAWSIGGKLEAIGVKLVKDMRATSKEKLINTLGPKTGEKMWEYARGIDKTEIGDQAIRKSVSAEVNWGVRFENQEQVDEFMHGLCGELNKRLIKERVKGKQLTMKVMKRAADAPLDPPKHLGHGRCDVFNKSTQLGVATNDRVTIAKEAITMMRAFGISPGELRGIGIQMQKLEPVKGGADVDQSSQRRLPFTTGPPKPLKSAAERLAPMTDPIQDEPRTHQDDGIAAANRPSSAFKPIGSLAAPAKRPLNTLGTQFVLPTQVDPSVLAELPEDIRAKLAKQMRPEAAHHPSPELSDFDRAPTAQPITLSLPTHSQIDPSVLEALPEDVRSEILAFYKQTEPQPQPQQKRFDQGLLPQSPRAKRTLPPPPAKRGTGRARGGGLSSRLRSVQNESNTLTQSNFVARQPASITTDNEEIDPEVLAALPEDLRTEVIAQQRQTRLQRTGGIDTSLHQRKQGRQKQPDLGPIDRHFKLPPLSAKPTFTSRKLSTLPELRQSVSAWLKEFSDEGPYDEDVDALVRYLKAVVIDERDVSKAVAVVKWLAWTLDEAENIPQDVFDTWSGALEKIKQGIQEAATIRKLGVLDFG